MLLLLLLLLLLLAASPTSFHRWPRGFARRGAMR